MKSFIIILNGMLLFVFLCMTIFAAVTETYNKGIFIFYLAIFVYSFLTLKFLRDEKGSR